MYINTAFCFDHNLVRQVQVAAASLLDHRGSAQTHYHIYCVCTKEAAVVEEDLRQIVAARDPGSELTMRVADNPYADSYQVRGISAGTYLRLELHRLLPEVDKILYTDVDTLFQGSLRELWETPLEGKFLAAVRGGANLADQWARNSERPYWHHLEKVRGNYINAGVTLMNLALIRERQMEEQWREWAKEKLYYQDQDILNITCQGAITFLPFRYNSLAYMTDVDYDNCIREGIYSAQECEEGRKCPVIIHYAGDKPWKRYDTNRGNLWWDYVKSQPDLAGLFDEAAARSCHGPTVMQRALRKLRRLLGLE